MNQRGAHEPLVLLPLQTTGTCRWYVLAKTPYSPCVHLSNHSKYYRNGFRKTDSPSYLHKFPRQDSAHSSHYENPSPT